MSNNQTETPGFEISGEVSAPETLVVGFSEIGLAGLTAVDYLADAREMAAAGHLSVDELPAITPFTEGRPRNHTRVYEGERGFAVLVGELFIPLSAAPALADELLDWAESTGVEEIAILSGVPVAHGPDQHDTFYVATADYQAKRLDDVEIDPIESGFLEGVNAELMRKGMDTDLRVGLLTTPAHQQAPDAEAALRLLDAMRTVYDLDLDTDPLESFAAHVRNYYEGLAERMAERADEQRGDDRMYM